MNQGCNGFDRRDRPLSIVLASTYAPDSTVFEMYKQRHYDSIGMNEILVEGTDANTALGTRSRHVSNDQDIDQDYVVGLHGDEFINPAGKALHQLLG